MLGPRTGVMVLTAIGVATGLGCRSRGEAPAVTAAAPSAPPVADAAACKDSGDAACAPDEFGSWTCPDGWGVCTRCAGSCQAELTFQHDYTLTRPPIEPLGATGVTCTGATYQLGYDERGRLKDSVAVFADGRREEVHLERDAGGRPIALRKVGADTRTVRWDRDAAGRVTREQRDEGGDGKIDHEERFELDPAGRTLRQRILGPDGRHGNDIQLSHDAGGRVVRELADHDGDGKPDVEFRTRHDGAGRVLEVWRDDDGDGKPDGIERTSYDEAGRLTRTWTLDGRGHTTADTRKAYDASGHIIREWSDPDGRGRVDWSTWHEVDAAGRPVRTREDTDGDGKIDQVAERSYDAAGRVTLERTDEGADGSFDERGTSYDAAGRQTRTWTDVGGDGSLEYERAAVYDADGLRVEARLTRRKVTIVTRYTYDTQRREIGTTMDTGADGTVDATTTTQYDGAGRRVLHRDRRGREARWRYDDQGRLIERVDPSDGGTGTCQFRYDDPAWARWRAQAPAAVIQESPSAPTED
jgi:YD repeat-containing protein